MNRVLQCIALVWLVWMVSASADQETRLVNAARAQVGKTIRYDPGYQVLEYPNGDVPLDRGVCTDVVVRALRAGLGLDLQKLVHEDMKRSFSVYPKNWGLKQPDKNIDHRRVPNLQTYFKRRGWSLEVSENARDYNPGDLVTCIVPPRLPHIMVVSDRRSSAGIPMVIHNIGAGTKEEDSLFAFKLTGHYRIKHVDQETKASDRLPQRQELAQSFGARNGGSTGHYLTSDELRFTPHSKNSSGILGNLRKNGIDTTIVILIQGTRQ